MTLSAFDSDFKLYSPSVSIEAGLDPIVVINEARAVSEEGAFCPHCYERLGLKAQVVFCKSETRRVHFRHLKGEVENQKCAKQSAESEKHKTFKVYVQSRLLMLGLADVKIEARIQVLGPGLTFRKPDVLVVYPNGQMEAHEIQVSRIDPRELERRTNGLKEHGCTSVVWYFYGGNYNDENRSWCHSKGVRRFKIWVAETYEDGSVRPAIKEDTEAPIVKTKPKGFTEDKGCSRSSSWLELKPATKEDAETLIVKTKPKGFGEDTETPIVKTKPKGFGEDKGCSKSSPWSKLKPARGHTPYGAAFHVGDRVTNKSGWHGVVTRVEEKPNFRKDPTTGKWIPTTDRSNFWNGSDGFYYWVKWAERMDDPMLSKTPEVGHLKDQIQTVVAAPV